MASDGTIDNIRDRYLEAKLVILGSSGVGKTSLLQRYINNQFDVEQRPTIGANLLIKRVQSTDTHPPTLLKMQIWDTAGQERFKAISQLYYRGADAALLCYDITNKKSFDEMGQWLAELRKNDRQDCIIHVVGTKADAVADDPSKREVPFEQCTQYISEQLSGTSQGALASTRLSHSMPGSSQQTPRADVRNSGVWSFDIGWDSCHEISAKDGAGVEEVFRVLTRKLVEQKRQQKAGIEDQQHHKSRAVGPEVGQTDYFNSRSGTGSFRLADKRRSWLSFPNTPSVWTPGIPAEEQETSGGRCCS